MTSRLGRAWGVVLRIHGLLICEMGKRVCRNQSVSQKRCSVSAPPMIVPGSTMLFILLIAFPEVVIRFWCPLLNIFKPVNICLSRALFKPAVGAIIFFFFTFFTFFTLLMLWPKVENCSEISSETVVIFVFFYTKLLIVLIH